MTSTATADTPLRQAWPRVWRQPGGWARRLHPRHTVSSMPRALAAPHTPLARRLRGFV